MVERGSPEWRERVRRGAKRGLDRRRESKRARPRDLDRLTAQGLVAESLRPIVAVAVQEAVEITQALGGADRVTPQQRILIEDLCSTGIALRGTLALYLQKPDPELGSRISTMVGARRANLALLGLERFQRELSLDEYLRSKSRETAPGAPIASEDAPTPRGNGEDAPGDGPGDAPGDGHVEHQIDAHQVEDAARPGAGSDGGET